MTRKLLDENMTVEAGRQPDRFPQLFFSRRMLEYGYADSIIGRYGLDDGPFPDEGPEAVGKVVVRPQFDAVRRMDSVFAQKHFADELVVHQQRRHIGVERGPGRLDDIFLPRPLPKPENVVLSADHLEMDAPLDGLPDHALRGELQFVETRQPPRLRQRVVPVGFGAPEPFRRERSGFPDPFGVGVLRAVQPPGGPLQRSRNFDVEQPGRFTELLEEFCRLLPLSGGETVLRDGFEVLRKPFEFGFPGQQAVEKQQPEKFEVCRGDAALLKRVQVDEAQLQPVDFDRSSGRFFAEAQPDGRIQLARGGDQPGFQAAVHAFAVGRNRGVVQLCGAGAFVAGGGVADRNTGRSGRRRAEQPDGEPEQPLQVAGGLQITGFPNRFPVRAVRNPAQKFVRE